MTPAEYTAARLAVGLTQQHLADALGVHIRSVQRREAGDFPITREAEMAIRTLAGARRRRKATAAV